jgi:hypothetical protein
LRRYDSKHGTNVWSFFFLNRSIRMFCRFPLDFMLTIGLVILCLQVLSTSIGSVSGWLSTRGSVPDQHPIHPLGVQACLSTTRSQNLNESSLNAPDKQMCHPISAKVQLTHCLSTF